MATIVSIHSFRGGTGKSNTTANLAAILAQQGRRVGVIDADIQSPGIHVLFGLAGADVKASLNDFLFGERELGDVAVDVTESIGGDAEFVATLLETFGDDASATLADLRAGLDAGDADAVRRAAHTLKSNAATFGASALAELCSELEAKARDGDLAEGETRLRGIEAAYAAVEPELAKLRDGLA